MTRSKSPRPRVGRLASATLALAAAAGSASAGDLANVTVLGFPGAQAATTTPYAINDSGEIAGQYLDPAVGFRVFSLIGGTYAAADPGPAIAQNGSYFASLNNAGQILGFANTTTPPSYGYYYVADAHGAIQPFPPFTTARPPGVSGYSGLNDHGAVAGQAGNAGFISQGGMITIIDPPTSTDTVVNGINDAGSVVGQFDPVIPPSPYANQDAFLYSNGAYTVLSAPGARFTEATGINDRGVVVGYFDGAPTTAPDGIQVTPIEGFTYFDGVYREYSVPGEAETELFGINDSGQVVGYYSDEQGDANGFTAVAVPEPAAWALLFAGFGALGLAARARRRRTIAAAT